MSVGIVSLEMEENNRFALLREEEITRVRIAHNVAAIDIYER